MKIFNLDKLIETLTKYFETRIELLKIELKEEVSKFVAKAILLLVAGMFIILFVLFLFLSLASFLNELFMSAYWGYVIVSGFFLLLIIFLGMSWEKVYQNMVERMIETEEGNLDNNREEV